MAAVVLAVSWTGLLVLGLAWSVLITFAGDLYCEHSAGDSYFGEFSWSIVPPGPQCTWTTGTNGIDETYGPTPVISIWLLALLTLGGLVVWVVRQAWASEHR